MPDQTDTPGVSEANAGESRRPFVRPALEDLGTLTIVTQQTVDLPP